MRKKRTDKIGGKKKNTTMQNTFIEQIQCVCMRKQKGERKERGQK